MSGRGCVLLGAAGVGKSHFVVGLAQRIAALGARDARVARVVLGMDVMCDATALACSSTLLAHVRRALREAFSAALSADVVLVLDNFDVLFAVTRGYCVACGRCCVSEQAARSTMQHFDAAVNSPRLVLVATSTPAAFERHVHAYWRLPQFTRIIMLREMTAAETFNLMRHRKVFFEHNCRIKVQEVALRSACLLAAKLSHLHLPMSALELMRETCAHVERNSFGTFCSVTAVDVAEVLDVWTHMGVSNVLEDLQALVMQDRSFLSKRRTSTYTLNAPEPVIPSYSESEAHSSLPRAMRRSQTNANFLAAKVCAAR
uniref:NACHT domain-containing protein n=1 Tax=Erythrolobus australicus TaxID=1077150 RepID=A0A7S1XHY1_9RHOD